MCLRMHLLLSIYGNLDLGLHMPLHLRLCIVLYLTAGVLVLVPKLYMCLQFLVFCFYNCVRARASTCACAGTSACAWNWAFTFPVLASVPVYQPVPALLSNLVSLSVGAPALRPVTAPVPILAPVLAPVPSPVTVPAPALVVVPAIVPVAAHGPVH